MQINFITIGTRMPSWVQTGYEDYAKRLIQEIRLNLIELPISKYHRNNDIQRILQDEGERMIAAIPNNNVVIALDVKGHAWDTPALAKQLQQWQLNGSDVSLLVGGPEGLAPNCLAKAQTKWSLSPLTFPHPLVRIIVAEQIYRAWSLSKGHPYHR